MESFFALTRSKVRDRQHGAPTDSEWVSAGRKPFLAILERACVATASVLEGREVSMENLNLRGS